MRDAAASGGSEVTSTVRSAIGVMALRRLARATSSSAAATLPTLRLSGGRLILADGTPLLEDVGLELGREPSFELRGRQRLRGSVRQHRLVRKHRLHR